MTSSAACDRIFVNGAIHTLDARDSIVEALAVRAGRIVAVGTSAQIRELASAHTQITDLRCKTVIPGLIDVHYHMGSVADYASGRSQIDLHVSRVKSLADVFSILKEESNKRPAGELLYCRADLWWDQKIAEKRFPTLRELDECCPDHPVAIFAGAHVGVVNTLALRRAGITAETQQPSYGSIEMDPETEQPTGRIAEIAWNISRPVSTREEAKADLQHHATQLAALGVTSINDLTIHNRDINIYSELVDEGQLPLRIRFYPVSHTTEDVRRTLATGWRAGFGNEWLRYGGIKLFLDGEWESGCSAMNDPYVMQQWPSKPNNLGQTRFEEAELVEIFSLANGARVQVLIHATGDRAIERVLAALEKAQQAVPWADSRHRIEHAGVYDIGEEQFARMKRLGCIPSPQPQFMHSMGDFFSRLFGENVGEKIMPYRSMVSLHRMCFPLSSDSTGTQPESSNPFWTIWCAVARQTYMGRVIGAEQSLTVTEAVKMMTIQAAHACFEDEEKGSLEVGKVADLVVLEHDLFTISVDDIKDVKVVRTVVGGQDAFCRSSP